MRPFVYSTVGIALLVLTVSPLHAGDTPADLGAEVLDSIPFFRDHAEPCEECQENAFERSWYLAADALIMRRELTNTDFPATSLGVGGPVIARLQDLNFDYEMGIRLTLGRRFSPWWSVEATYFGIDQWSDAFVVSDQQARLFGVLNRFGTRQQPLFPAPPFPPTFGVGNNTTIQTGEYLSQLYNGELNAIHDLCGINLSGRGPGGPRLGLGFLFGIRYMRLVEEFSLRTRGNFIPAAGINDPSASADYVINVQNDFFGGQFGGRFLFQLTQALSINLDAKLAILANGAQQDSNALFTFGQPIPIVTPLTSSAGGLRTSTLGQLGVTVNYKVRENITLRGGYEILWLNGRVLAPDQVDANVAENGFLTPLLLDRGTTRFYGYTVGLQITF